MAFGQYNKTIIPDNEENSTAGSSSFSSWNQLLASQPRKRALGRVKTMVMPQRMSNVKMFNEEDEENLTPHDVSEASKTLEAEHDHSRNQSRTQTLTATSSRTNIEPQRLGTHQNRQRSRDIAQFLKPQRANSSINKTLEKPSSPMLAPQRAVAKTRFGHPVSPIGSPNRSTSRSINEFPMPQRASSKARLENPPSSPIRSPKNVRIRASSLTNRERMDSSRNSSKAILDILKPGPTHQPSIVMDEKTPERPQLHSQSYNFSNIRQNQNIPEIKLHEPTPPVQKEVRIQQPEPQQPRVLQPVVPSSNCIIVNGKMYTNPQRIGKGGSSCVYRALDAKTNEMRAIKRVDLSEVSETEADAFRNEVQLLQRLQGNKKIIKLFDYEERLNEEGDGTELFVVMEQGERDLANLLKEVSKDQELTDAKTKFYWEEMLETVDVVHQEKIIHSDLKPANFLIVNGTIKIIDFGIASKVDNDKTHVTKANMMGTFNYMSPEAIRNEQEGETRVKIGVKSDVWSLGCILYQMVYKKLPFGHIKMPIQKMMAILDDNQEIAFPSDPSSLRDHDVKVVDVLKRCLERNSSKRASISELRNHPYLKGEKKKKLGHDQLVSLFQNLTPNTQARFMHSINPGMGAPPTYNQDA